MQHDFLCPAIPVEVDRKDIVASVLKVYEANKNIQYHRLHVTFTGEIGMDDNGLTREMFWHFFESFANTHLEGCKEKVPNNDHRLVCNLFNVYFLCHL